MRRRRQLTDDERALWTGVARSIVPLRGRRASTAPPSVPPDAAAHLGADLGDPVPAAAEAPPQEAPRQKTAAPLAPLGRRLRQRVARGRDPIDDRIDLHGMTQSRAHAALLRFLQRAQAGEARIVLVVTGKGTARTDADGERGVLRRQVPLWLALPEFRSLVVGFEDAHVGHGGQGALYVRLRRAQRTER
jgi:DNA-nicking Smr family endonuclease